MPDRIHCGDGTVSGIAVCHGDEQAIICSNQYSLVFRDRTIASAIRGDDGGGRPRPLGGAASPELSRTRVQELIEEGLVLVNGKAAKDSHKVHANDVIRVVPQERPPLQAEPEAIPLDVLYEDDDVIAINTAGMSVHAGAGNSHGTAGECASRARAAAFAK